MYNISYIGLSMDKAKPEDILDFKNDIKYGTPLINLLNKLFSVIN